MAKVSVSFDEHVAIERSDGFIKLVQVTWHSDETTYETPISVIRFRRTDRKFAQVWPVFEQVSEQMKRQ